MLVPLLFPVMLLGTPDADDSEGCRYRTAPALAILGSGHAGPGPCLSGLRQLEYPLDCKLLVRQFQHTVNFSKDVPVGTDNTFCRLRLKHGRFEVGLRLDAPIRQTIGKDVRDYML